MNTASRNGHGSTVALLGLGLMGTALAKAVLKAGHPLTVWNRTASRTEPLTAEGATAAGTVAEAIAAAPVLLVCLTNQAVLREVLHPQGPALVGRSVVNLTTGTSADAAENADWAEQHGVRYLEGVIMSTPPDVGGTASILFGGDPTVYADCEPVLRALGEGAIHIGVAPTLPALFDVAMLSVTWSVLNGYLHGAALLRAAGAPTEDFLPSALGVLEVVGAWLPDYTRQIETGVYPAFDATLNTHRGGMAHLLAESEALGLRTDVPALLCSLADRAIAAGRGSDGYTALIEEIYAPQSAVQSSTAAN
jgi:3-hydroxyisobutyrate dehydrogenase-like beta-hydroxyacid dehydrogenase